MNIAIIGCGAMGSVYAAHFAEAGVEVWAVDTWSAHVAAMNADGLRIDGPDGSRVVPGVHAVGTVAEAPPCDLYVIATKAAAVASAASAVAAVMPAGAVVLTIQNGLGAEERLKDHIPAEAVLLGVAEGFGASMTGPGHVDHKSMKQIRIGEPGGGKSTRLEAVVSTWRAAGFNANAFDDIQKLIWEKFVCNVTFSGPCTVFACTVGELIASPHAWSVARAAAREAHAVGLAREVAFGFDDVEVYVTAFGAGMPDARPSMLLDHLAQRRSEIDAINGAVVEAAKPFGLATPVNEALSAIVRHRELAF